MSDAGHVVHYVAMSEEQVQDRELMRRAAGGSRDAVAEIARRYVGFVYAAALRQVRDAHLAEDVTQAVFVILAQKAGRIKPGAPLHAWLFTTTRYAAANATKLRNRRQFHERQAAAMREQERSSLVTSSSSSASERVTSMLDEGLAQLRESDRSAILLSYMAGKSWREVADALGTTEEAARKRVSRAVAQLRGFFARRGVATTAPAIVAVMTTSAEASVPPALLGSITVAVTTGAVPGAAASSLIAKGAVHMMTWAQIKVAAAFAVVLLSALALAGAAVLHRTSAAMTAAIELEEPPLSVQLDDGVTVQFLGVARLDGGDAWWNPDGTPVKPPDTSGGGIGDGTHQVVIHVQGEHVDNMGIRRTELDATQGITTRTRADLPGWMQLGFEAGQAQATTDLRLTIAAGEWQTVVSKGGAHGSMAHKAAIIGQCIDTENGCVVAVTDNLLDQQTRVVAVAQDGTQHHPFVMTMGMNPSSRQTTVVFPIAAEEVEKIEVHARPFDQFVVFKNISLEPGHNRGFVHESGKVEPKQAAEK